MEEHETAYKPGEHFPGYLPSRNSNGSSRAKYEGLTMAGYNGWRNRETWLVNLWFGDYFSDMDPDDITEDYIEDLINEHVFEKIDRSSFIADLIDLQAIDYQELVEHYQAE